MRILIFEWSLSEVLSEVSEVLKKFLHSKNGVRTSDSEESEEIEGFLDFETPEKKT